MLLDNTIFHVVFGTCNSENTSPVKVREMRKIHICLIKNGYFAAFETHTEPIGFGGIMRRSFFDQSKFRQKRLEIQLHMTLCRSFTPAMLCPVNAVGNELNRGRVNRIDRSPEPPWQTGILVADPEVGVTVLCMGQHIPEECLGHIGVSNPVCVRQSVPAGRCRATDSGQNSRVIRSVSATSLSE